MSMRFFAFTTSLLIAASSTVAAERLENLTLDQATEIALQNHRSLRVSQASLDMAEAQYRQAMAAFRPKVGLTTGFERADQDRSFTFEGSFAVDPGAVFGGGPGTMGPARDLPISMDVKLFDRDVTTAALTLSYPLYTGGKQEAITAMARTGVAIAREGQRKSALDVVRDVNKYYNGAQYARQMAQLSSDTLARFEVLDELTERLYQNTSLKVKKTDYLRSKTTTALVRSTAQEGQYAATLSQDALANAMGLPLGTRLSLAPPTPPADFDVNLEALISDAMAFNPDKQQLELAHQVAGYKIDEAKSGYLPVIGLEASVHQFWNSYKSGLINDANRQGWTIGVGLKWDLFDSGLTKANVDAAQAAKIRLEAQRELFDNGLALQIKDDVMRIQRSRAQVRDNAKASELAQENRQLNARAYEEEMVETKDVIEAQLIESFAAASHFRAIHELQAARADLEYRVGKALK
jgi:outer membrane protein